MKEFTKNYPAPDIIVPVKLSDPRTCTETLAWLNRAFGFRRFSLYGLSKSLRALHYPAREEYIAAARQFAEIREWAKPRGLSCGWTCMLTVKSGPSGFTPIIRNDGSPNPFASCPLDGGFAGRLAEDIALFASVAHPDFIFMEDDFSVSAADGCFCEAHLAEFARRTGRVFRREEVLPLLSSDDPAAVEIHRKWRTLKQDTLVSLAEKIRAAVDREHPEIPIGIMQSGGDDKDGCSAEALARALAGKNHTPFVRLFGTFYCGFRTKQLPRTLFHSLWCTENLPKDILCYHETDTYPHTRYYTSGKQAKAMLAAVLSYGMSGSVFWAAQTYDTPYEENAYGKVYAAEQKRFAALASLAAQCRVSGVELGFDPFYNSLKGDSTPGWTDCLGRFGIPFTAGESSVAFWDARQAKYCDDETVLRYLAKGLFLDGEAAKILCERGFGKYLGVSAGEAILKSRPRLVHSLGASEVICEEFAAEGEGRKMPCAHAYCPAGNGQWIELTPTDDACQTVTCGQDYQGDTIAPTMTYYENALGGKVAVMSLTVRGNPSQALFNYRRQRLLQRLTARMADEYPFVREAPDVYMIALEPCGGAEFLALLTLINLCDDDAENVLIYLPPKLRGAKQFMTISRDGTPEELAVRQDGDGIQLLSPLRYCEPVYVIIQ